MSDYSTIYQASPDEAIKAKLEEHIKQILDKPSISNEDYELLKKKLAELPVNNSGWEDPFWAVILLAIMFGFGGGKK